MLWPYVMGAAERCGAARIDRWIPRGARRMERHAVDVPASPGAAFAAVGAVRLSDVPMVRSLFRLRRIPYRSDMGLVDFFRTPPFLVLDEEAGCEVVFGVVGPFWRRPSGAPRTPDEFRASAEAGRMAAIGNFRVEPAAGGSRLWTETWVSAPGLGPSAAFTAYWLAIGPFSAWIRRMLLRAAKRKA